MKKYFIKSIKFSHIISSSIVILGIILINAFYFSFNLNPSLKTPSGPSYFNGTSAFSEDDGGGKLAIIIDDFGQNRNGVKEMMAIRRPLTFAVMPFLQFTKKDAEEAYKNGYEVIAHIPMESDNGKMSWLGPKPVLTVMSDVEIQETVIDSIDDIPHVVGANIHMGAKAGDDSRVISEVLDVIDLKNMYFVDSRASHHPIAKKLADAKGITCFDRDVFLDGKKSKEYIKKQLERAGNIALKKGSAVAIGHVGTEGGKITAEAITEMLDEFDDKNIKLVFVSDLINN